MKKVIQLWSCALVLVINLVCGQYVSSPCPDVFSYDSDGSNVYGTIRLTPRSPVSQLVLKVNFTVASQLFSNYVGRIDAENNNLLLQKYNQGVPVSYRVHFPVTSPLPKLTALTVNGDTICYGPGDVPRPNQYVTTLSLQHTSFLQGGGGQMFFQPQSDLEVVQQFGDDANIYTFNNIDNSPSFSNVNTSRPPRPQQSVFQQPPRTTRPPRPIFNNEDQYNQSYEDRTQRPTFDRNERPVFQQTTRQPVFQQPVTRPPTRPPPQTTMATQPFVRPTQPTVPAQTNNECGVIVGGNEQVPLIYNGSPFTRGDLPWLSAMYRNIGGSLSFACGGTLISNRHILSAAHCMFLDRQLVAINKILFKLGVYNLDEWGDIVVRTVISANMHESYNTSTNANDILILTLNKVVDFSAYIRPACLWGNNIDQTGVVGATGVVAGWGNQGLNPTGKPGDPSMVRLPIVSTATCRSSRIEFHQFTSATTFCAGERNGAGPCTGDSGGGFYLLEGGKWRVRGIVSQSLRPDSGERTCNVQEYLIFTDAAQFLPWIRNILNRPIYD